MSTISIKLCALHLLFLFVLFSMIGPCVFAQGNIDVPQHKSKTESHTAISVKLAADKDGDRVYYTTTEWDKLPIDEKVEINKIGLLIGQGDNAFLLSLFNNMGRGVCGKTVSFQEAFNKTGNQLPTKTQMQTVKNNKRKIGDALEIFGGDHICSTFFWCKDGSYINMDIGEVSGQTSFNDMAMFRIATNNTETGFNDVIIQKEAGEEFDYVGPELTKWQKEEGYLRMVSLRGKYGFINANDELVIPLKYDSVDCGYSLEKSGDYHRGWNGKGLMSVCINSKWGYINNKGEIVVPTIYDIVESRCDPVAIIKKEGRQGIINEKADFFLPIKYDEIEGNYYAKDVFFVKKNSKYGFFNSNYKEVIPFKYDFVTGFYRYNKENDHGLCGVGINGKYGYIDKKGIEVIPLIFEFVESFYHGLAGVVLNNRLGFIDIKGAIVIPPQYNADKINLSIDYGAGSFGNTRPSVHGSFEYSPYIALVPSASFWNYLVINNKGESVSAHVYERCLQSGTKGFTLERNGKRVYLDIAGIEYDSEDARASNEIHTWEVLANRGFVDYQNKLGYYYTTQKDYHNAYAWFYKASQNGSVEAFKEIGDLFYNGYLVKSRGQSKDKALEWYKKYLDEGNAKYPALVNETVGRIYYSYAEETYYAKKFCSLAIEYFSKSSTRYSLYLIGWMYEHGQGVERDLNRAIDYYKKSDGYKDAKERITFLQSQ